VPICIVDATTSERRRKQMAKLYIVTMKDGADLFTELVFAVDFDGAKEAAEARFENAKAVNVCRAACRPGK
jgi:hypothetical protein